MPSRFQFRTATLALAGALVAGAMYLAAQGLLPHQTMEAQPSSTPPTLKALQQERVSLAEAFKASVVAIARTRPELSGSRATGMAAGRAFASSGFVVDDEYVITSIESQPMRPTGPAEFMSIGASVWMMAHDGTEFSGKVAGTDLRNLLLLVKMDDGHPKLPSLRLGDSDKVAVGASCFSLGNTLDSLLIDRVVSFSFGTVSGFYRFEPVDVMNPDDATKPGDPYKGNVLEVDSAILPGDYGGPVFNLDGEVIAMMSQHYMAGRYLGCTVPSNQLRAVLPQLKRQVPEAELARGYLGMAVEKPDGELRMLVFKVDAQGPAARAGIKVGHELLRIDNFAIPGIDRLREMLGTSPVVRQRTVGGRNFQRQQTVPEYLSYGAPVGTHIQLTVRDPETGRERTIEVVVGEKPEDF